MWVGDLQQFDRGHGDTMMERIMSLQ
jgi:hypothetical protein